MNKQSIAIFDIDGVLSDHSSRIKLARAKLWNEYHAYCQEDAPHARMIQLAKLIHIACGIIICTARPEMYKLETETWLNKHGISYLWLYMRKEGDIRKSDEVKKEMLARIKEEFMVWFAVDDQDHVVKMYREEGVMCLQIEDLIKGGHTIV